MRWRIVVGLCGALFAAACSPGPEPVARIGVEVRQIELAWPARAEVEFALEPLTELPVDAGPPRIFVHLLNDRGELVRDFDRELGRDWWPGDDLRVPSVVEQSALREPLPPGRYRLTAGLYDPVFGRYAVIGSGGSGGSGRSGGSNVAAPPGRPASGGEVVTEVPAADVIVPPTDDSSAALELLAGWLRPAAVASASGREARNQGDRGVRLLASGEVGGLRLSGAPGQSRLFLTMALRGQDQRVEEIELDRADEPQQLTIQSDCFAAPIVLEGDGVHRVEADISTADGDCVLRLLANYRRHNREGGPEPVAELHSLAWNRVRP